MGKIDAVDNWLAVDCPSLTGITVRAPNPRTQHNAKGSNRTFVAYIRNYIDHPGPLRNLVPGKSREAPSMDEIGESIGLMLRIIEACRAKGIGKPITMP